MNIKETLIPYIKPMKNSAMISGIWNYLKSGVAPIVQPRKKSISFKFAACTVPTSKKTYRVIISTHPNYKEMAKVITIKVSSVNLPSNSSLSRTTIWAR